MKSILSSPSKMPCASFNLPAMVACPAAKLSIKMLGSKALCVNCYAMKGRYAFANVKNAQKSRLEFVNENLENGVFVKTMIEVIAKATKKTTNRIVSNLFRVHDSGDLFSTEYIKAWIKICQALPNIKFWFPTREWIRMSDELKELASLPNVALRPSALSLGDKAPSIINFSSGTTVLESEEQAKKLGCYLCPATKKGNPKTCKENGCQACFCKSARKPIAYMKH
jgi:hypothetical protein